MDSEYPPQPDTLANARDGLPGQAVRDDETDAQPPVAGTTNGEPQNPLTAEDITPPLVSTENQPKHHIGGGFLGRIAATASGLKQAMRPSAQSQEPVKAETGEINNEPSKGSLLDRTLWYRAGGDAPKGNLWNPMASPAMNQFQAIAHTRQYIREASGSREQAANDLRRIIDTPDMRSLSQDYGKTGAQQLLAEYKSHRAEYESTILKPAYVRALRDQFVAAGGSLRALSDFGINALDSRLAAGYVGIERGAWLQQRDRGGTPAISPVALDKLNFMLRLDATALISDRDTSSPIDLLLPDSQQAYTDTLREAHQIIESRLRSYADEPSDEQLAAAESSDGDVIAARVRQQQEQIRRDQETHRIVRENAEKQTELAEEARDDARRSREALEQLLAEQRGNSGAQPRETKTAQQPNRTESRKILPLDEQSPNTHDGRDKDDDDVIDAKFREEDEAPQTSQKTTGGEQRPKPEPVILQLPSPAQRNNAGEPKTEEV